MIKLAVTVLAIIGLIVFTPLGAGLRAKADETFNPIVKQRTTVADLSGHLAALKKLEDSGAFASLPASVQTDLADNLAAAESEVTTAADQTNTGDLAATVSGLVHAFTPSTARACGK